MFRTSAYVNYLEKYISLGPMGLKSKDIWLKCLSRVSRQHEQKTHNRSENTHKACKNTHKTRICVFSRVFMCVFICVFICVFGCVSGQFWEFWKKATGVLIQNSPHYLPAVIPVWLRNNAATHIDTTIHFVAIFSRSYMLLFQLDIFYYKFYGSSCSSYY